MPVRAYLRSAGAALLLGGAVATAQAGLFDDEEARKAIVDLRSRLTAVEDAGKARAVELGVVNTQLLEQLSAMRRSMVELNNQLETMRGELATLRGNDEQMLRDLAELQRKQKDVSQNFDDRLRAIEPVKVSIDGREAVVPQEEKRAYDDAIAAIRGGDFDKSVALLTHFQRRFADSAYVDSVRFWLGNALYGKRDYKEAISAFRSFVAAAGEHPRAPEAMLALANSQAEMKDARGARKTIEDLMKTYPRSEAAQAGKERLASIR
ncbi:MAG: tol-pal system protein YbgF [Leptothrix sp. (in: Bacteria)]|nr:tol-pal system protein YbgF [Leptothrix sp. (in: b-proteobacteria)]